MCLVEVREKLKGTRIFDGPDPMMHSVYFPGFFLSIRHTMINICPASDLKNLFEYKKPMELILKLPKVMDGSTHMRRLSLGWFCCPSKTTSVFHPVDPEMSLVLDFVNDLLDFVFIHVLRWRNLRNQWHPVPCQQRLE